MSCELLNFFHQSYSATKNTNKRTRGKGKGPWSGAEGDSSQAIVPGTVTVQSWAVRWGLREESESWRVVCTTENGASRPSPRGQKAALGTEMAVMRV